jgi:hypothetical protein
MDSQSVKTVEESARIRGYDAHKHVKGRKRHTLVDTLGLPLSVYVTPADMHGWAACIPAKSSHQVADPRRELESFQVVEGVHEVGNAGRVHHHLAQRQLRFMVQRRVKRRMGLAQVRRDDLHIRLRVLIDSHVVERHATAAAKVARVILRMKHAGGDGEADAVRHRHSAGSKRSAERQVR